MKKNFFFILFSLTVFFAKNSSAQWNSSIEESIHDSTFSKDEMLFQNIINHHPLIEKKNIANPTIIKKRKMDNNTLPFLFIISILFVFAFLKNIFLKHFTNLFNIFTSFSVSKRQMKEQLENSQQASIFFLVLYFLGVSFIIFKFLQPYFTKHPHLGSISPYFICLGIVVLFWLVKNSLSRLVAYAFNQQSIFHEYYFSSKLINEFTGLLLFPICLCLVLLKGKIYTTLLISSFTVLVLMYFFKYVRAGSIFKKLMSSHYFHFFLYFCTFEIIPLLFIVKWLKVSF